MLFAVSIVVIGFILFLKFFGEDFFYYPNNHDYGHSPDKYGQHYERHILTSKDGTKLEAWFIPSELHRNPQEALGTVLYYHGNSQNLTVQYGNVHWLPKAGFNVFAIDYRGFGNSEGAPSIKGVFEDGIVALEWIRGFSKIDPSKLFVIGQSLGGNVAAAVLGESSREGILAIVLDSTFYSYPMIASDKLKGAGYFIDDKYSAYHYIKSFSPIPILFLHGEADKVVPAYHSRKLFDDANEPKEMVIIPNFYHIETFNHTLYQEKVIKFFKQALVNKEERSE